MLGRVIFIGAVTLIGCDANVRGEGGGVARAPLTAQFTVYGEQGARGVTGGGGTTGPAGSAPANGLNLACTPNALQLSNGGAGVAMTCGSVQGQLDVFGSADGTVSGTAATVTAGDEVSLVVSSGDAATPALAAENANGVALKVVGKTDFTAMSSVKLPLNWVIQVCGDDAMESATLCKCSMSNQCSDAVAACGAGQIAIGGHCGISVGHVGESCPGAGTLPNSFTCNGGVMGPTGFLCRTNGVSTVTAYALCMDSLPP